MTCSIKSPWLVRQLMMLSTLWLFILLITFLYWFFNPSQDVFKWRLLRSLSVFCINLPYLFVKPIQLMILKPSCTIFYLQCFVLEKRWRLYLFKFLINEFFLLFIQLIHISFEVWMNYLILSHHSSTYMLHLFLHFRQPLE